MVKMKLGDYIVSNLDIFFCDSCKRKLMLIDDSTNIYSRMITMWCVKCKTTYTMEIRKV